MRCDMCGSEEQLFRTDIEGAEMAVCHECSKYGEVLGKIEKPAKQVVKKEIGKQVPDRPEIITIIKKNYPKLVKKGREKKGLKQEDMAQQLGEKTSVIHQIETGHMEPSMKLARKLENFLGIRLVEEYEEKPLEKGSEKASAELTIGDMIKVN